MVEFKHRNNSESKHFKTGINELPSLETKSSGDNKTAVTTALECIFPAQLENRSRKNSGSPPFKKKFGTAINGEYHPISLRLATGEVLQ